MFSIKFCSGPVMKMYIGDQAAKDFYKKLTPNERQSHGSFDHNRELKTSSR